MLKDQNILGLYFVTYLCTTVSSENVEGLFHLSLSRQLFLPRHFAKYVESALLPFSQKDKMYSEGVLYFIFIFLQIKY